MSIRDMDVDFRFPPPIQLLFHEQAKSTVALQGLQNEVSSLLEFKKVLLESYPHLGSKLGRSPSTPSSNSKDCIEGSPTSGDVSGERRVSWNLSKCPAASGGDSSSSHHPKEHCSSLSSSSSSSNPPLLTNVSDSGFGNSSSDLKDASLNLILREDGQPDLLVDELNDDELLLLLDVIHRKTVRMRKTSHNSASSSGDNKGNSSLTSSVPRARQRVVDSLPSSNAVPDPSSIPKGVSGPPIRIGSGGGSSSSISQQIPHKESSSHSRRSTDEIVHSVQIRTRPEHQPRGGPPPKSVNIEITNNNNNTTTSRSSSSKVVRIDSHFPRLSELNLSKIGKTDRLDLREIGVPLKAASSSGSHAAFGNVVLVMENREATREKIRKILNIKSVIELRRQLLGTVIENEFYKSYLENLWEAWNKRIKDFESQNESLQSSLSALKSQNESLQVSLSTLKSENESLKSQVLSKQPFSWMSAEANKGLDELIAGCQVPTPAPPQDPLTHFIQPDSLLEGFEKEEEEEEIEEDPASKKPADEFYDSISHDDEEEDTNTAGVTKPNPGIQRMHRRKLIIPNAGEYSFSSSILESNPGGSNGGGVRPKGNVESLLLAASCDYSLGKMPSNSSATAATSTAAAELRRVPITEKLKRKILGW